ncbi:TIGR03435 family protein [Hymenobacter sp. GOD-10R]|uniref:TIGR03435 family protein n=1 Tax=Hymenobacter sp. GOD-10R TaxID=3093922 RepID=UPI002D77C040|nr:TIGR03435 family protein [Hymenobacter sp. GOD-10R]WRQ30880.1 TIGR03435 family protein [Hymenobacter sp. GOD-10R]
MSKTLLFSFVLLLTFQLYSAKAAIPKVGEAAPQLKLTKLLQTSGKTDESIKSLQGKAIVLEFWATWCAPCIAAMPHLNALSEKYKGKDVQFISITDQTEDKARLFLKKRAINGWVGLDTDRTMYDAYEVNSIPFTVVIDAKGLVAGYPKNNDLSEAMLDQVLAGGKIAAPLVEPKEEAVKPVATRLTKPIYELSLRPSTSQGTSVRIGTDLYSTTGASALDILKVAFDATLKPIEISAPLPEGKFDVVATNSEKNAPEWAWRTQLQQMLQDAWGITVRQENKAAEAYELSVSPAAQKRLKKADPKDIMSHQSTDDKILAGSNVSMDILAKTLQEALASPVLNVTNLSGSYDYTFDYDQNKPETLIKSVEKETGLKLLKVKRPTNFLVIGPRS